jgi:hypothetical protein
MEKIVEVEMRDGTKKAITLWAMTGLERLDLQEIITPDRFNPNSKDMEIEKGKWKEYRKKSLLLSIKEPIACRQESFLGEITAPSFEKLFDAAQEVNEEKEQLSASAEKKSESPSKGV